MKDRKDTQAYPSTGRTQDGVFWANRGLTKREVFAMHAPERPDWFVLKFDEPEPVEPAMPEKFRPKYQYMLSHLKNGWTGAAKLREDATVAAKENPDHKEAVEAAEAAIKAHHDQKAYEVERAAWACRAALAEDVAWRYFWADEMLKQSGARATGGPGTE